jgi:hypothetical protein
MRNALLLLAVVVSPKLVLAEELIARKGESLILGAGSFTCARFANQYRSDPTGAETYYSSWLLGFLNGINTMAITTGMPKRDLNNLSIERAKNFMRNYCNDNPLKMYIDGARLFASSLPVQP